MGDTWWNRVLNPTPSALVVPYCCAMERPVQGIHIKQVRSSAPPQCKNECFLYFTDFRNVCVLIGIKCWVFWVFLFFLGGEGGNQNIFAVKLHTVLVYWSYHRWYFRLLYLDDKVGPFRWFIVLINDFDTRTTFLVQCIYVHENTFFPFKPNDTMSALNCTKLFNDLCLPSQGTIIDFRVVNLCRHLLIQLFAIRVAYMFFQNHEPGDKEHLCSSGTDHFLQTINFGFFSALHLWLQ